jgi:RimJ/RimL family protein N-acetyltransferase
MIDGLKIYLRPVKLADARLLYKWRNEKLVRDNSFEDKIILYKEHKKWLMAALQNPSVNIYIMMDGEKVIGQVRLNIENKIGLISYSIDLQYRCMGYGKKILQLIENEIASSDIDVVKLLGCVKKNNKASQKVFETLGYQCEIKKDYFEYIKICRCCKC